MELMIVLSFAQDVRPTLISMLALMVQPHCWLEAFPARLAWKEATFWYKRHLYRLATLKRSFDVSLSRESITRIV